MKAGLSSIHHRHPCLLSQRNIANQASRASTAAYLNGAAVFGSGPWPPALPVVRRYPRAFIGTTHSSSGAALICTCEQVGTRGMHSAKGDHSQFNRKMFCQCTLIGALSLGPERTELLAFPGPFSASNDQNILVQTDAKVRSLSSHVAFSNNK